MVSHDLQHQYMEQVTGLKVVLSGYHASIGTYGHQEFSYAHIARAHSLMEDLGIGFLTDRRYAAMSTGEQRRCLLARALVHGPSVLVLDEPTSGLDLTATFHYLDLVRGYMRKGKTILLVTHHIHEIPPEIRRVVLLKKGKVIQDGEKKAVLSEQHLSNLFDCRIVLACANGWYQGHGKRQICVGSTHFHCDPLARSRSFNQVVLQMRGIENFRVLYRQQDVMLLNARAFRWLCHILHGDPPFRAVFHCSHVNAQF
jgi:ABC-type cobalamin/Fe3+-siderophores transport system ATPase subunit